MLQLEIEDSSDEESVDEERSSRRPLNAAFSNSSSTTAGSTLSNGSRRTAAFSSRAPPSPNGSSSRFFRRNYNNGGINTSSSDRGCCFVLGWLWNGGQSPSSRWIRRFAILGMASLLLYHASPVGNNWNPVEGDEETSSKLNPGEEYIPPSIPSTSGDATQDGNDQQPIIIATGDDDTTNRSVDNDTGVEVITTDGEEPAQRSHSGQ